MGVLVEALSVIVPVSVLVDRYPEGLTGYQGNVPNGTFCTDGSLTRVGFMAPPDVKAFIDSLMTLGLEFHNGQQSVDIAVVDQFQGPTAHCPWLECGRHEMGFAVAWLRGTNPSPMAAPRGWTIEQSSKLGFVPNQAAAQRTLPLLRQGMVDSILDFATGKVVYVGRTTGDRRLIL